MGCTSFIGQREFHTRTFPPLPYREAEHYGSFGDPPDHKAPQKGDQVLKCYFFNDDGDDHDRASTDCISGSSLSSHLHGKCPAAHLENDGNSELAGGTIRNREMVHLGGLINLAFDDMEVLTKPRRWI